MFFIRVLQIKFRILVTKAEIIFQFLRASFSREIFHITSENFQAGYFNFLVVE